MICRPMFHIPSELSRNHRRSTMLIRKRVVETKQLEPSSFSIQHLPRLNLIVREWSFVFAMKLQLKSKSDPCFNGDPKTRPSVSSPRNGCG